MRLPVYRATLGGRGELKMTAMIDVVFLLLIFFVCTASFQKIEELLPTNIRSQGSQSSPLPVEPPEQEPPVVISLRYAGGSPEWVLQGRTIKDWLEVRTVLARLAAVDASMTVILDIGPNVPLGDVVDLYDVCRAVGFEQIQFAAKASG